MTSAPSTTWRGRSAPKTDTRHRPGRAPFPAGAPLPEPRRAAPARLKERFRTGRHQAERLPVPGHSFRRNLTVDPANALPATPLSSTCPERRRRTRYRTAIHSVSPAAHLNGFGDHEACFLGVSLENSSFTPARFDSMLKWVSRHFSRCTVLIGDSIHRLTLASTGGMDPDQALEHALDLGRQFVQAQQPLLDAYRAATDFTVVTCSQVQETAEYAEFHYELRTLFAKDDAFRASVEAFGRAYHAKHSPMVSAAERRQRIDTSSAYFLEEFAVFCCLTRRDLPVMVYPGQFSTLAEISAGLHPQAPDELRDLTLVSLRVQGR
ncbi:tRNA-dependent cyclodipeptide synthase [Streptomyces sp. NPDC056222]|uniref:tRNA-dependent cyclodipeptide synthase n=1 Tax=Streptomyces sp. NPDC056222 TaxID=3345749 RepID=UPI0035D760AB